MDTRAFAAVAALVVIGLVSLLGCSSSSPQACKELRPATEEYQAAQDYFTENETRDSALLYQAALTEYRRTVSDIADTSSAREEGIADDLRNFAVALAQEGDGAVALTAVSASAIQKVCGFSPFGQSEDES